MTDETCEKLAAYAEAAQSRLDRARVFLADRAPRHEKRLRKLRGRLRGLQVAFSEAAGTCEQVRVAEKLLSEIHGMVSEVEGFIDGVVNVS